MVKDSLVVLAQHLRRPCAATAMLSKCATRRGTHACSQFVCAWPSVQMPDRALVSRCNSPHEALPFFLKLWQHTPSVCSFVDELVDNVIRERRLTGRTTNASRGAGLPKNYATARHGC